MPPEPVGWGKAQRPRSGSLCDGATSKSVKPRTQLRGNQEAWAGRSYHGGGAWIFGVSTVAAATGAVIVCVCAYKREAEKHENIAKKSDDFRTAVLLLNVQG